MQYPNIDLYVIIKLIVYFVKCKDGVHRYEYLWSLVPEQHVIHVITDPKWFDFHAWGYKPTKDDQFDTEVANLRSLYELLHTRFGYI